ncbi:MAG: hypothetical protein R3B09_30875 [Nannocystaceae bacterium]
MPRGPPRRSGGRSPRGPILFWNTHSANDLQRWITHGWERRRLPTHLADRLRLSP